MKVSIHNMVWNPLLTKFEISQSVLGQFTWYLAQFEGVIMGHRKPVLTGLNRSIKTGLLRSFFSNFEKTKTAVFKRPVLVRSFSGLFPVFRPDLKALFRPVPIPPENLGLAADDLDEHHRFITALALVMQSWKGEKPVILSAPLDNIRKFTRQAVMQFETVVTKYYCQQFFNYFGRLSQISHHLFAPNNN